MSDIPIRPATPRDLAAITRIYDHAVRHGTASWKNGFLWAPVPGNPLTIQLNTAALSFSDGTQVGLIINSAVNRTDSPIDVVLAAYNGSWMPMAE